MRISVNFDASVVRWMAARARPSDIAKFCAMGIAGTTREQIAAGVAPYFSGSGMMLFSLDEESPPIVVGGAVGVRPNVVQTAFFATVDWPDIARPLSRWIRNAFFPALRTNGVHRIQTLTLAGHPETDRWLTWLGMKYESWKPGYGSNGETFVEYAWVADDFATRPS